MASRIDGTTLLELLVALTILGVMAGLVGLVWRPGGWNLARGQGRNGVGAIREARLQAVESGRSVTTSVACGPDTVTVLAMPDGRLIGVARCRVDPLAGIATVTADTNP